jgi:hypothetical protein
MATAKKRGVPAPAPVRQKKLTRKEKSAINKVRAKVVQEQAHREVKAMVAARVADWPLKPVELRGKDDPSLPTDRGTKVGRPSVLYTKELDEKLFELLCVGTSLDDISSIQGTPGLSTMLRWLSDDEHKFTTTYTRARKMVVPLYEDRALKAALSPVDGVVKIRRQVLNKFGTTVDIEEERVGDAVERGKLMLAGYQWALGWLVPKKHGRNAQPVDTGPNTQLQALFDSLKQGPKDG